MNVKRSLEYSQLRREFGALKRKLSKIGFISTGSVIAMYKRCGKTHCVCHQDVKARHGPYFVWTRKVRAKTVTRTLTPDQAELCKRCIANMREVEEILERMKELSVNYIEGKR
jgi:hypothetical protein